MMRKIKFVFATASAFIILALALDLVIVWASPDDAQIPDAGHSRFPAIITSSAGITISKGPALQQVRAGQYVTFTLAVTNTGEVTLTNVSVTDPLAPPCDRDIGELTPGADYSYQCSIIVDADMVNTATVSAEDDQGNVIEASSDAATVDITPSTFTYDDVPDDPIPIKVDTECFSSNMITRTFTVGQDFIVGDVNIGLNITHTFRSQVWAFLTSPKGTKVTLTTDCINCDDNDNYDMMLDDDSNNPQDDGDDDDVSEPYYDRDAAPYRPLSDFIGEPAQGTWTLEVCDKFGPTDYGSYNRSRLVLQDATLLAHKQASRVILDPQAAMNYTITLKNNSKVTLENIHLDDPTPSGASYTPGTLQATTGVASEADGVITWQGDLHSSEMVTISYASAVITSSAVLITNTATITHPILAEPITPTIVGQVFTDALHLYTNEEDIAISDGYFGCQEYFTSTVNVPEDYYIGDIEAGVTAKHTMRADLLIDLISPWGETVRLDNGQGGSSENLDARFADRGTQDALATGNQDVGAPYYEALARPPGGDSHRSPLSVFDAHSAQGDWKLQICDDAQVDTGSLHQWTLFVEEANVWLGHDTAWNNPDNWSKGHVPTATEYVIIPTAPEGGEFPVLDADVTIENLLLKENAQLDLQSYTLNVEDYMDNYGVITQTLPVTDVDAAVDFLHITNSDGDKDQYQGVVITPTLDSLGQVTVTIRGNQSDGCTDVPSDSLFTRCYNIQPEHPYSATIKFYYTENERNKQDANNLSVWDRGYPPSAYQWRQVGDNFSMSETSAGCTSEDGYSCWVQAENVATFGQLNVGTPKPPDIVTTLQSPDVKLSWHDETCCITRYEVWRAPSPYFNPTFPEASKLGDVATNSSNDYEFIDAGAASAGGESYFYVVRTLFARDQTDDANIVGVFNYALSPGSP